MSTRQVKNGGDKGEGYKTRAYERPKIVSSTRVFERYNVIACGKIQGNIEFGCTPGCESYSPPAQDS